MNIFTNIKIMRNGDYILKQIKKLSKQTINSALVRIENIKQNGHGELIIILKYGSNPLQMTCGFFKYLDMKVDELKKKGYYYISIKDIVKEYKARPPSRFNKLIKNIVSSRNNKTIKPRIRKYYSELYNYLIDNIHRVPYKKDEYMDKITINQLSSNYKIIVKLY